LTPSVRSAERRWQRLRDWRPCKAGAMRPLSRSHSGSMIRTPGDIGGWPFSLPGPSSPPCQGRGLQARSSSGSAVSRHTGEPLVRPARPCLSLSRSCHFLPGPIRPCLQVGVLARRLRSLPGQGVPGPHARSRGARTMLRPGPLNPRPQPFPGAGASRTPVVSRPRAVPARGVPESPCGRTVPADYLRVPARDRDHAPCRWRDAPVAEADRKAAPHDSGAIRLKCEPLPPFRRERIQEDHGYQQPGQLDRPRLPHRTRQPEATGRTGTPRRQDRTRRSLP
jgi:hypothetical protein